MSVHPYTGFGLIIIRGDPETYNSSHCVSTVLPSSLWDSSCRTGLKKDKGSSEGLKGREGT